MGCGASKESVEVVSQPQRQVVVKSQVVNKSSVQQQQITEITQKPSPLNISNHDEPQKPFIQEDLPLKTVFQVPNDVQVIGNELVKVNQQQKNIFFSAAISKGIKSVILQSLSISLPDLIVGVIENQENLPQDIPLDDSQDVPVFTYRGDGNVITTYGKFSYNQNMWKLKFNEILKLEVDMNDKELRILKQGRKLYTHTDLPNTVRIFVGMGPSTDKIKILEI